MALLLTLCYFLTFVSLMTSLGFGLIMVRQTRRIKQLEADLRQVRRGKLESFQSALEPDLGKPVFEGLRVGLFIQQDHERPIFAQLLKERLTAEDAFVTLAASEDDPQSFDLVIKGVIVCNSYTEAFYSANLECSSAEETILAITEKPPQGGRQVNLANELISRLKREMEDEATRRERLRAISQLRGDSE